MKELTTQACRLTQMMEKQRVIPSYELILPFVQVSSKVAKAFTVDDVLLLDLDSLDLTLLQEGLLYAKVKLIQGDKSSLLEIVELKQEPIETTDSKKYEILKLSFGLVQCREIEEKVKLPLGQINFETVSLILKNIKIAQASLVLVDEKIALKITKVEK